MHPTTRFLAAVALAGLPVLAGCGGPSSAATTVSNMEGAGADMAASSPPSPAAAPAVLARADGGKAGFSAPAAGGGAAPACPAAIGAGLTPPAGARVMGTVPTARTALSYAALVSNAPADVRDDRTLAEEEPDTTADDTPDGAAVHQVTATAAAAHSLACGYGMKPGFTEQGTLLVIPLPADVPLTCRVRLGPPGASKAGCTRSGA